MRAADPELPGGLVTFLFTDVEGSTRLHERLGDAWGSIVQRHDALLGDVVRDHGGAVVKWLGDGMFAAFADAAAAVRAATAIGDAVAAEPWGVELRVRAGLHTGPAQPRDGDYTALAVHVAARVCGAAHGGQVLVSGDVPGTSGWTDLGEFVLAGLEAPVRLLAPPGAPTVPPRARRVAKHNVPAVRTSFVGRATELAELGGLVARHGLVSVLGPGGTGKTRIAFELARRTSDAYADGAWVVLLADLPPGGDIAERVATTLGVRPAPGRALRAALADWCSVHEVLVVLDNCEHVVPSAAALVGDLLGAESTVRFVVTSREPLRLPGEVSWRLPALPDTPEDAPADAVLLFLDRARLARPDADLSGETHRVAELCRRLDGLPLAIELAAARLRHMTLDGLLANLRDRVRLLRGRTHGVDERHQSLEALLDWSHDLLPDDERAVFRRCAVIHSAFTAATAAAVCALPRFDAEEVLERLADRSLLQVTADVEPRFRMLGTIRDYALDRLREAGEEADTARRHAAWVTDTLVPVTLAGDAFEGDDVATPLALFGGLHDDAVAALGHFAGTGDTRLADLANAMFWYWLATGTHATAAPWLRLAGERGDVRALARAGTFANWREPGSAGARELLARALEPARAAGDERLLGECLVRYAAAQMPSGDRAAGEAACREVLGLAAAPRDRGGALLLLGVAASYRDDEDGALAWFREALAVGGGPSQLAIIEGNIADILIDRGETTGLADRLLPALETLEARQPSGVPWICRLLYRLAMAEGDVALAARWLDHGLRTIAALGATESPDAVSLRELKAALPPGPERGSGVGQSE